MIKIMIKIMLYIIMNNQEIETITENKFHKKVNITPTIEELAKITKDIGELEKIKQQLVAADLEAAKYDNAYREIFDELEIVKMNLEKAKKEIVFLENKIVKYKNLSEENYEQIKNWNQWYEQHNPLWIAEKIELDTKTKTLDTIIQTINTSYDNYVKVDGYIYDCDCDTCEFHRNMKTGQR